MNIGVDIKVCRKVECKKHTEFQEEGRHQCKLMKCNSNIFLHQCPVPDKCPCKALHIINEEELDYCINCPEAES